MRSRAHPDTAARVGGVVTSRSAKLYSTYSNRYLIGHAKRFYGHLRCAFEQRPLLEESYQPSTSRIRLVRLTESDENELDRTRLLRREGTGRRWTLRRGLRLKRSCHLPGYYRGW